MAQTIQILRTTTNNPPPTLLPGALSAELGTQTKLWIGAAAGNRLLLSTDPTDITLSGGAIIASAAPNAMPGSLWWDSNIGQLYIRYFDGNSTAWVSASTGTSIAIPIAIASGGTSAITAPAALTALGALPVAGGTMTGALTVNAAVTAAGAAAGFIFKDTAGGGNPDWTWGAANGNAYLGRGGTTALTVNNVLDTGVTGKLFVGTGFGTVNPTLTSSAPNWYTILYAPDGSGSAGRGFQIGSAGAGGTTYGTNDIHTWRNAAASVTYASFQAGGTYNVSGSWLTISDESVKSDVQLYERGLADIVKLEPVSFRYTENAPFGVDSQPRFGLIAQQVQLHIPEVVGSYTHKPTDEDGKELEPVELSTLDPGALIYSVINAIKELNAKVEALTPAPGVARR